ncbi:hypothetical protein [Paenibacillus xanthanilyticus]|uniref:DUF4359 domain-containing protein n=1 Tax=Paenibacillus xanthanilyticus TaxID=1783531 RepID=A0ABV8KE92_9BACL
MKRYVKAITGILLLVLGLLYFTCPDEEDYKLWLEQEHGITCEVGGPSQIRLCTRGQAPIEWESKHVRTLPFYIQVEDKYADDNMAYTVRATGVFNHFFDKSSIVYK